MQITVKNLENYIEKYSIDYKVSSNLIDTIIIEGFKDIQIIKYDETYVIKSSLESDIIHAEISTDGSRYVINYCNGINKEIRSYDLTAQMINIVIGNVLFQEEIEEIEEVK